MGIPYKERYFEDYAVGEIAEFGDYLITQEEIVSFAKAYDPQAFHIDPEAAKASSFGGLAASGWMTGAVVMRMMCDYFIPAASAMGSPGLDQLRWPRPVRPGDRLRVRVTVLEARRSQSKPDRGVLLLRQEAINQDHKIVMLIEAWGMYRCRN